MTRQDNMISYIRKRDVVKSLEDYATGQSSALARVILRDSALEMLRTVEGKAELNRWLKVFITSRRYMSRFDAYYQTGTQYNDEDWRLMDQSVVRMLNCLEDSLVTMNHEKSNSESQ